MISMKRFLLSLLSGLAGLQGCAYQPPVGFHALAIVEQLPAPEQAALSLPFDAYLVGIEKNNAKRVGEIRECSANESTDCLFIDAPYFASKPELRSNLRAKYSGQYRPTLITHVARFDQGSVRPCFLANDYAVTGLCQGVRPSVGSASVASSWDVLDTLGDDLGRRMEVARPTHVVVYTMGWNTYQVEALRNIRNLHAHLVAAAASAGAANFSPLVIGVTWPSTGDPKITATDFGIKAKDADEVGAVWINALIHKLLPPLKARHGFKVVVIGHSFGARATSRATFSAPLITARVEDRPTVDLLIGLQGAYSYQRFLMDDDGGPEGSEGAPYRDYWLGASTVLLTSSRYDTAVTAALHADYFVGSDAARRRSRASPRQALSFNYPVARADGTIDQLVCGPGRIAWVDASEPIAEPEPNTGGGAHSGIYTAAVGRMTFQALRACAN